MVGNRLYVPDWGGRLWCLDATTGAVIWQQKIYDLVLQGATKAGEVAPYPNVTTPSTIISRASPIISGTTMVRGRVVSASAPDVTTMVPPAASVRRAHSGTHHAHADTPRALPLHCCAAACRALPTRWWV